MSVTDKRLCKGTFGTTNATLYTAPATEGNYAIIKALTLCNKTSAAASVTIKFGGVEVIAAFVIQGNDTITVPFMDQIIEDAELIEGLSNTADAVNYYISGKEVV